MGIAKALTNDLERALRLYRIPVLTAMALSFRRFIEDRFLLTDDRDEDARRNVVRLRRVTAVEQNTTKPGIGVDDRQFTRLTGNLLFTGLADTNGVVQPLHNLTNTGGATDLDGTLFTSTGSTEQKQAKAQRYNRKRPGDVTWRIRTPVMMADETTVIDYLTFRCTQLKYLQSITLKWSDRRWDARIVGLDQDLYRPDGEKSDMITLAPMWMDASMSILSPEIWGPFEDLIRANYEEYLGRKIDEQIADCAAFTSIFQEYLKILTPDRTTDKVDRDLKGRVSRYLDTTSNRALHIPFDRNVISRRGNDSYRIIAVDPETSLDVTEDIFNTLDGANQWRMTSSFEASDLAHDGWCGTAATTTITAIASDLPPYTKDRSGNPVYGTKAVQVSDGFICRRMVLPNGSYGLSLWVKNLSGEARVEVIRNNRLRPKGWVMSPASRVTSVKHWRENYETITGTTLRDVSGWQQISISFSLIDHLSLSGEGYPAHECYIVLHGEVAQFDHLSLYQDTYGHNVKILNTVNLSSQPYDVRPELRYVNLENAFVTDSIFGTRESAANCFRIDGKETVVTVEHRASYNVRKLGTTIDTWVKINSVDEAENNILGSRGSFTLFQKTGSYLPGYACTIDRERFLHFSLSNKPVFSSKTCRNTFLHPSVGNAVFPPRTDWLHPNIYDTFKTAFRETGLQPTEWIDIALVNDPLLPNVVKQIGGGKFVIAALNDPYWSSHTTATLGQYLNWHASQAYAQAMPADRVAPSGMESGFVFAPIPLNAMLYDINSIYGDYSTSPGEFSPRELYSPAIAPFPTSPLGHSINSHVFTPSDRPSPAFNRSLLHPIDYPISPGEWGGSPVPWPADSFVFGPSPSWIPFSWDNLINDVDMRIRHPMVIGGKIRFDRWLHLNIVLAENDVEVGLHGLTVIKTPAGGTFVIDAAAGDNGDDLLIGTNNIRSLKTAAPISVYSFKVFQQRMSTNDRSAIFSAEAVNFNELQYNIYKDNLDYDGDRALDFWQEGATDYGLWTVWPDKQQDPHKPYPSEIQDGLGRVQASTADLLHIAVDVDRDRSLIADWFDASYLQELIDTQTIGLSDGLIMWDFMHPDQAQTYDYRDRVYDPVCQQYLPRTLSYLEWMRDVLNQEWNSVTAVQDPIPTLSTSGSPHPLVSGSPNPVGASPWPVFGDSANELVMTGVKGWFGFDGLLGYRDSLEKVSRESVVFNYLQVEFHFRSPRSELEALLKPYAHSIDQIFEDDYVGNHLSKQSGR